MDKIYIHPLLEKAAMFIAAANGHLEILKLNFATFQYKNPSHSDGMTPFHYAALFGNVEVCKFLVENVMDKNPSQNDGRTPFHYAAHYGNLELCKLISNNIIVLKNKLF